MKKLFVSCVFVAGVWSVPSALAADVWTGEAPSYPVVTSTGVHDWSGLYAGVNGGYASGDFNYGPITLFTPQLPPEGVTFDVLGSTAGAGWIGGGQAGVNVQHGSVVFGIEGDIQFAGIDADRVTLDDFPQPNDTTTVDLRLSSFATVRGRLGVAADRLLAYATGGLAIGRLEADIRVVDTGGYDESSSDANTHYGYSVGGGLEYALTGNWSIKGEYLYANFGSETYEFAFPTPSSGTFEAAAPVDFHMHLVRLGLNYNF